LSQESKNRIVEPVDVPPRNAGQNGKKGGGDSGLKLLKG